MEKAGVKEPLKTVETLALTNRVPGHSITSHLLLMDLAFPP